MPFSQHPLRLRQQLESQDPRAEDRRNHAFSRAVIFRGSPVTFDLEQLIFVKVLRFGHLNFVAVPRGDPRPVAERDGRQGLKNAVLGHVVFG